MKKSDKLQKAQYIAGAATVSSVISLILMITLGDKSSIGMTFFGLSFILSIVSYTFGGFGKALKSALTIAKAGWYVIHFPFDLITFPLTFFFAFLALFFLPIIPIRKIYKESLINEYYSETI